MGESAEQGPIAAGEVPPIDGSEVGNGATDRAEEDVARRPGRLLNSELELLISGAVIFSLFRLPGLLQGLFGRFESRLSEEMFWLPFLIFYLGSLLVLTLIVCFSAHFLLRSFWVALAGLNLVFPDGIRWDSLDVSPIQKRIARETFPGPRDLERRMDRIASTIFSVLFFLVLQLLFLFALIFGVLAAATPVRRLLFPQLDGGTFVQVLVGAILVPLLLASLADRWFKSDPGRLDRHPRIAAVSGWVQRLYFRILGSRLYVPIQFTFASHFSTRTATIGSVLGVFAVVGLFIVTFLASSGLLGFDSYVYLPERTSALGIEPRHYENLAAAGDFEQVPTVQSDVITGPFVRLFVPYRVERDTGRLREVCPDLEPLRHEGLFFRRGAADRFDPRHEAETVACLKRVYEIELNGAMLRDPDLSLYRHPGTGERGVLAHLPTGELPAGRNLLVVRYPPRKNRDGSALSEEKRKRDDLRRTAHIPFWLG